MLQEDHKRKEDGSIKIPKALWKYTGFKVIENPENKKDKKIKKK